MADKESLLEILESELGIITAHIAIALALLSREEPFVEKAISMLKEALMSQCETKAEYQDLLQTAISEVNKSANSDISKYN